MINNSTEGKILLLDNLIDKVKSLKHEGKIVVQTHGVFDLIHPGIIKHLNKSKNEGDILIVTVIKDKDVRRGPGRPIFPEDYRIASVASLEQVDFVCLVDDENPFECVQRINPDVFAKGQALTEHDRKTHKKLYEGKKELLFGKSRIHETDGFLFSSPIVTSGLSIINNFLDIYSDETRSFLKTFSKKYSFEEIVKKIDGLENLKVLLIGDGIIDEYHYCESMGKSPKAQLIVNKHLSYEVFPGGAFAIANHIASITKEVQLVTLLGNMDSREDFILKNLKPNVNARFFYRDNGPTVIKKRYINQYQNQKLFEINYINDEYVNSEVEEDIISYLESVITNYDLVLVSDFGHGFITNKLILALEESSKYLAVNAQTNGANAGYNLITKYNRPNFICLDTPEARLATQDKFSDIEHVGKKLSKSLNTDNITITMGKQGSICFNRNGDAVKIPGFSTKVVDVIGAGDAFFSYAAPCVCMNMPMDLVSFIGNAVGALDVQIVGNKKTVEKGELLEFIHTILK
ncbi:MAG: adenylyltransferase/cytidyltransferase family protein [Candidatus Scalindua sp.]|jgi:rfaE bifunctional protein kinase chain/domain|nr:adenylyltransferase/cytidyltransferase family protein [Candidatus Scalindua sp.]MBT6229107.1 adenylyltransferase/cytidyltransferase family protein [Candidatus Scalindua sp.]